MPLIESIRTAEKYADKLETTLGNVGETVNHFWILN